MTNTKDLRIKKMDECYCDLGFPNKAVCPVHSNLTPVPEKEKWKELTVGEALAWSDKHRQLTGEGARVIHIQQLLKSEKDKSVKETIEKVWDYANGSELDLNLPQDLTEIKNYLESLLPESEVVRSATG